MVSTRGVKFDFCPGEYVLCFEPDLCKARVLYEAKVLEAMVSKDAKGRRRAEYMVHFAGWNNSWDRVVPESYVVKNSDRNRILMRRLAVIARRVKKNKTRMRRIDKILKEHFKKRIRFDSDSESSATGEENDDNGDDGDDDDTSDDAEGSPEDLDGEQDETDPYDEDKENVEFHHNGGFNDRAPDTSPLPVIQDDQPEDIGPKDVKIDLPPNLKRKLEFDCIAINRKDQLIKLPSETNVIAVLEGYVKNFGVNVLCATIEKQKPYTLREPQGQPPERNIDLCKEVMDGIRVFFDFALPLILLYDREREQYAKLASVTTPLVKMKTEPEDMKALQASDLLTPPRGHGSPEPRSKIPRLSPRNIKKEEESDSDDDDDGPSRRITRKAFAEEVRRTSLKGAESSKSPIRDQPESGSGHEGRSRRSGGHTPSGSTKGEGKSLRSRTRNSSDRSGGTASNNKTEHKLTDRVSPPPPLLIAGSVSSSNSSNVDTPTSSAQQSLFQHREAAVNEIFAWKMLPDDEYNKVPSPPSLVYGAHHLLRFFVRLPEYVGQMAMPRSKMKALEKHLELFVEYLSSRADELFPENVYEDAPDSD